MAPAILDLPTFSYLFIHRLTYGFLGNPFRHYSTLDTLELPTTMGLFAISFLASALFLNTQTPAFSSVSLWSFAAACALLVAVLFFGVLA